MDKIGGEFWFCGLFWFFFNLKTNHISQEISKKFLLNKYINISRTKLIKNYKP